MASKIVGRADPTAGSAVVAAQTAGLATIAANPEVRASARRTEFSPQLVSLVAGWGAGTAEALSCHSLDTTKVRMQTAKNAAQDFKPTFVRTFVHIINSEGPAGLYSGVGPVVAFMGPKIAIRFTAYEALKRSFARPDGKLSSVGVLAAGLGAGVTEAAAIVTPMEVIKIKIQSGELLDGQRKYRGTVQTIGQIIRDSGFKGLYTGLALTATRQATNQASKMTTAPILQAER